jgi:protein-S-isoprenylcysteine O-methyltransferase Ste14
MKPSALFVTIVPIPAFVYVAYMFAPAVWGTGEIVGLALLFFGMLMVTIARIQLGNAFSVTAQANMLVTRGLYSRIRNPVYVFSAIALAGLLLYLNRPPLLLVLVPLVVVQVVRAGRESKVLEERFGDAYREYKAKTWF